MIYYRTYNTYQTSSDLLGDLATSSWGQISWWNFFLAKSTDSIFPPEPAWLGDVSIGSLEKTGAVDLAKKKFHWLF